MFRLQRLLLLLFILIGAHQAKADFVDIATIRVNQTLVRKLTHNHSQPYLVNLSRFKTGDTLKIEIWTDYGGQYNCTFVLENQETHGTDTLRWKDQIILTKELLEKEHRLTVIYQFSGQRMSWNICVFTPDPQIEEVYHTLNNWSYFLNSASLHKGMFTSPVLSDSIETNFVQSLSKKTPENRVPRDVSRHPIVHLSDILFFSEPEVSYLQKFIAEDYVKHYNLSSNIHGNLILDETDLSHFSFSFGDNDYHLEFCFELKQSQYKLTRILYKRRN